MGGIGSGWSLFFDNGQPGFRYVTSQRPGDQWSLSLPALAPGKHSITLSFDMEAGTGMGGPATVRLSVDGGEAKSLDIAHTVSAAYASDAVGIGRDVGSGITRDQPMPFVFEGMIDGIEMTVDP